MPLIEISSIWRASPTLADNAGFKSAKSEWRMVDQMSRAAREAARKADTQTAA